MDDIIKFILNTFSIDENGVERPTRTERAAFCKVGSITRTEFFSAGRNGLNPEFVFTVFTGDYHGEELVEFKGKRYSVYRTYMVPGTDYMEIYVERKGGTNGKNAD